MLFANLCDVNVFLVLLLFRWLFCLVGEINQSPSKNNYGSIPSVLALSPKMEWVGLDC